MKKIGDLMKELGFSPDSSLDTQKAFVKNLVKNLPENRVYNLDRKKSPSIQPSSSQQPVQLSFEFGDDVENASIVKKPLKEVS
ncbi:MAG TPA: hypothetical protein PLJ21_04920 [Pseudobdellovibrionaceae bacterium]|nr:hypothetical protein [Pseudobdellovibrionaceae bacterium]